MLKVATKKILLSDSLYIMRKFDEKVNKISEEMEKDGKNIVDIKIEHIYPNSSDTHRFVHFFYKEKETGL